MSNDPKAIAVWDPLVRVFHWTVAIAFFVAYLTEGDPLIVHVWAGYTIGTLVVLRVIWGFVGPKHARFSDFVFAPWTVWSYLVSLVTFRAKRYVGHSPAGGAMVVVLLAGLAATVWAGLETLAVEENAGPLAELSLVSSASADPAPASEFRVASEESLSGESGEREEGDREGEESAWKEIHEVLANLMLFLVIAHLAGVALASVVHRENLPRAMVTGRKRT